MSELRILKADIGSDTKKSTCDIIKWILPYSCGQEQQFLKPRFMFQAFLCAMSGYDCLEI
ncbi:hypothetical protein EEL33_05505 [Muribaculaceae bacterium Isolate-037 (Harlan)]|nr:hypothetical protein EEL33_05505 [Muribaculaceae bacterium Isolate-037 (Harlan)]